MAIFLKFSFKQQENNCCGIEKNWEVLLIDVEKALNFLIQKKNNSKKSNELFKIQKL
jgi:hypothetical protein